MNLPDTFAGGTFNLTPKVAKIARLGSTSEIMREIANRKLKKYNYFLDRVGIIWDIDKIPEFAKDKENQNV